MNLNKKGILMLPLAALLLTSCTWKNANYSEAKKFIQDNYDSAEAKAPTKVHEKFDAEADDDESEEEATQYAKFFYFYSLDTELDWKKLRRKCKYEDDYIPEKGESIHPIDSEYSGEFYNYGVDELIPSDEEEGITATYQINGKKFKQSVTLKERGLVFNRTIIFNDQGFRLEIVGDCTANGEVRDPVDSFKFVEAHFKFTFSSKYTY